MTPKIIISTASIFVFLLVANFSFAQADSISSELMADDGNTFSPVLKSKKLEKKYGNELAALHTDKVVTSITKFISENITYTDLLIEHGVEGEMIIELSISKSGELELDINKGLNPNMDEAVLATMKSWNAFDFDEMGYKGARRILMPIYFYLR